MSYPDVSSGHVCEVHLPRKEPAVGRLLAGTGICWSLTTIACGTGDDVLGGSPVTVALALWTRPTGASRSADRVLALGFVAVALQGRPRAAGASCLRGADALLASALAAGIWDRHSAGRCITNDGSTKMELGRRSGISGVCVCVCVCDVADKKRDMQDQHDDDDDDDDIDHKKRTKLDKLMYNADRW